MKKTVKILMFLIFLFVVSATLFAQDSTVVDSTAAGGSISAAIGAFLGKVSFWIIGILALLEVVARVVPSASNWAPLTKVLQFLQAILDLLPNKNTNGEKFVNSQTITKKL